MSAFFALIPGEGHLRESERVETPHHPDPSPQAQTGGEESSTIGPLI